MLVDGLDSLPGTDISSGLASSKLIVFSGDLSVLNKFSRWFPHTDVTINEIIVSVGEAATGSDIQLNIKKNDAVLTGSPIALNAGSTEVIVAAGSLNDTAGTLSDSYTFDLLQVGSTTPGRDLVVQINYSVV